MNIYMVKFSDKYQNIPEENIPSIIADVLFRNKHLLYKEMYSFVQMPNNNLGVCTSIFVPAGSNSILIRREPIVIEICGNDIEHSELRVYPDRDNFPYENFPHINYPVNDLPPTLCLTREPFCEWYSEHTFSEFICLIQNWYKDALNGNLIKFNGEDFFEPFRPTDAHIYLFKVPYEDSFAEKYSEPKTFCFAVKSFGDNVYMSEILDKNYQQDKCEIGVLLTRPMANTCKSWFIKYPKNINELIRFIDSNGFVFCIEELQAALTANENKCTNIIIQLAFPRPLKVLGKNSRLDYLTFLVSKDDLLSNNLSGIVHNVIVYDLTTIEQARFLSNTKKSIEEANILILGCGAIGSKLATHLYRSGLYKLTICDNDTFQPHNVCRHALFSSNVFEKKTSAMKKALDSMYVDFRKVQVHDVEITTWLPQQDLSQYDLIIDATASASVFRLLDKLSTQSSAPCIRFSLSDAGNLGLLYIKNENTSLLSDFYMFLVSKALDDDDISNWLSKEVNYNHDFVRIGEGCHSNTMILSDDIISTHTAIASSVIRNMFENRLVNQAYLSFVNIEYQGQVFTDNYTIPKFISLQCCNDTGWNVRIPSPLYEKILHSARKSRNREIGGYMMGCVDIKYKTIYVLHHYIPEDSNQQNTKLSLGKKGWRKEYENVIKRTANIFTYIGDWHSHPKGSLMMSTTDIITNYTIKQEEIDSDYGLCLITNGVETKAHLLKPNVKVIVIETEDKD